MSVALPDADCSRHRKPGEWSGQRVDGFELSDEFRDLGIVDGSDETANVALRKTVVHGALRMPLGIEKWNKNLPPPPSEMEAIAENHFGDQMVCGMGHAHAEAEIDFPIRRKIKVDRREDLVLLLAGRKKIRGRAHRAVVLESPGDFFGEIIAELEVRREGHSLMDAVAMEGTFERGIKRPVPRPRLFIDNRPHLPGPGVGRKLPPLIADFIGKAEPDGPLPFLGYSHAGPDVVAHPLHALAAFFRRKDVEAGLKPIREAASDFNCFMKLMMGGQKAVIKRFRALKSEIAVQLHHGVMRLDGLVAIHLNLVIVLRPSGTGERRDENSEKTADGGDAQSFSPSLESCSRQKLAARVSQHGLTTKRSRLRGLRELRVRVRLVVDLHQLADGGVRVALRRGE